MNKTKLMSKVSGTFNKASFQLKKHSPEILVVVGVVGVVTSAVMACKATLKVNEVIDTSKTNIDKIHKAVEKGITEAGEDYSAEDGKKELAIVYVQTGVKLAKLYAPSVCLGALSISSILASNNILRKRNVALAAAYATVDSSFKDYRNRVVERFGKELDKELRYNIKTQEVEETIVNEDGTETVVKKTIEVANPNEISEYGRCFDETCRGWTRSPEHNLSFILGVQAWANQKLKEDKYLFLNDVYEALGFLKTEAGQAVGWIYDDSEGSTYDNCVDFGIHDLHNEQKRLFVNGYEKSIWLDFNVDGVIWKDAFRRR